eukprot:PhF_6_TR5103/c0_g1_i3/m.7194
MRQQRPLTNNCMPNNPIPQLIVPQTTKIITPPPTNPQRITAQHKTIITNIGLRIQTPTQLLRRQLQAHTSHITHNQRPRPPNTTAPPQSHPVHHRHLHIITARLITQEDRTVDLCITRHHTTQVFLGQVLDRLTITRQFEYEYKGLLA